MRTEVKNIPFENGELLGIKTEDGKVWLAVKKACLDIGLSDAQARAEVLKIQESLLFKSNCLKFKTVQMEGKREVNREILVLSEKFVPMWLAQINLTPTMQRTNPDAVKKLLKYQMEASDVLHQAFYETEEQKESLHTQLGVEGKIASIEEIMKVQTVQINNMETMMELQYEQLTSVIDNMTLSTRQQNKILEAGRKRVNYLLGGAHSPEYKRFVRMYMANLWNNFKSALHCGSSYKDLNPKDFTLALDYISNWIYEK